MTVCAQLPNSSIILWPYAYGVVLMLYAKECSIWMSKLFISRRNADVPANRGSGCMQHTHNQIEGEQEDNMSLSHVLKYKSGNMCLLIDEVPVHYCICIHKYVWTGFVIHII